MAMCTHLRAEGKTRDRLYRLFAVACVNAIRERLTDSRSRDAVDVAELYADGLATDEELRIARNAAGDAIWDNASDAAEVFPYAVVYVVKNSSMYVARSTQAAMLRAVIGPSNMPSVMPCADALRIARHIYTEKDWMGAPILADALEDRGADPRLLLCLRGLGPWMRGHWALDVVLGKRGSA